MTEALTYVIGIGITAGILALILHQVREEHPYLRFFLTMLLLTLAFLLPNTFWDARVNCESVVSNSTAINTTTTVYEYEEFCFSTTTRTPGTFQTIIMWSYYLIIGYIVLWFIGEALLGFFQSKVRK